MPLPGGISVLRCERGPYDPDADHLFARLFYRDRMDEDMTLERLGFSESEATLFAEIRMAMQGCVFIGGRAGDGKSTTLAVNLALQMAEMEGSLNSTWSRCYSARRFDADRHANPLRSLNSGGQICAPNNSGVCEKLAEVSLYRYAPAEQPGPSGALVLRSLMPGAALEDPPPDPSPAAGIQVDVVAAHARLVFSDAIVAGDVVSWHVPSDYRNLLPAPRALVGVGVGGWLQEFGAFTDNLHFDRTFPVP